MIIGLLAVSFCGLISRSSRMAFSPRAWRVVEAEQDWPRNS